MRLLPSKPVAVVVAAAIGLERANARAAKEKQEKK